MKFAAVRVDGSVEGLTKASPIEPRSVTAPGFDRVPQISAGEVVRPPGPQSLRFPTDVTVPVCSVEGLDETRTTKRAAFFSRRLFWWLE